MVVKKISGGEGKFVKIIFNFFKKNFGIKNVRYGISKVAVFIILYIAGYYYLHFMCWTNPVGRKLDLL